MAIAAGVFLLGAGAIWWYGKPIALDAEIMVECRALYDRAQSLDDTLRVDARVLTPDRRLEITNARVSCGALRARGRLEAAR